MFIPWLTFNAVNRFMSKKTSMTLAKTCSVLRKQNRPYLEERQHYIYGWLSKYRLLYKAPVFDIPGHLNPHLKLIIFDTYSWSCMSGIWQLLFMQVIYVLLEACDIKYNGQWWVLWEVWSVQSSVWCMQRTVTSVQSAVWSVQCKMWCAVSGMQNAVRCMQCRLWCVICSV